MVTKTPLGWIHPVTALIRGNNTAPGFRRPKGRFSDRSPTVLPSELIARTLLETDATSPNKRVILLAIFKKKKKGPGSLSPCHHKLSGLISRPRSCACVDQALLRESGPWVLIYQEITNLGLLIHFLILNLSIPPNFSTNFLGDPVSLPSYTWFVFLFDFI